MLEDVEKFAKRYKNRQNQIWIYLILVFLGIIAAVVTIVVTEYFSGYIIAFSVFVGNLGLNILLYTILKSIAKNNLLIAVDKQVGFWKYEAIEEAIMHIETSSPVPLEKITIFANEQLIKNIQTRYPSLNLEIISTIIPSDAIFVIQDLVAKDPSLGTYHQVEQFFIKKISKPQIQFDSSIKELTCYNCGSSIGRDHKFCNNCQKKILICSVCKLPINFGSEIGSCFLCDSVAHLDHLQEWVKTQGKCPNCLQEITLEGIVHQIVDLKKS